MDERVCGDCDFFRLSSWHLLPEQAHKLLRGWGLCESTGRIMHESTPCSDCEDFREDGEGEDG